MSTIAEAGDAVILPTPLYFNHKMWLDTTGVETRLLQCGEGMLPDPEAARALIDENVKAILLVTPNNPTGAEYPVGLLEGFMALAKECGLALIIDESYRNFHSKSGTPHNLFAAARLARQSDPSILFFKGVPSDGSPCWRSGGLDRQIARD
ncbi:MAG: aminotransferase class I/II-fold pyridoxal phosphate-dependent enzyme [Paracoccaceae bacterium]